MSSEEREVYIMQDADGDEWMSPTPASVAIFEAVTEATDLDEDDLDDIETYVDCAELRRFVDEETDGRLTITVEGHDVTIHGSGDIDVTN